MKLKWIIPLILLATGALLPQSEPENAAKAKVMALDKPGTRLTNSGHKALGTLLDDAIVLIEDDGSIKTKAEFLASVKSTTANEEQVSPESMTVHVTVKPRLQLESLPRKALARAKPTFAASASSIPGF